MRPGDLLLLRSDAGPAIGTGHVLRGLALAQAWIDAGGSATFAVAEAGEGVLSRLAEEPLAVERISAVPGSAEDAAATSRLARGSGARWVVVDGYHFSPGYREMLRKAGVPLLAVDDNGEGAPWKAADAILNQNLHAEEGLYATREAGAVLMLGPRWALLRREFAARRPAPRAAATTVRRIVATFGGADPSGMAPHSARALASLAPETRVTIVAGLADSHTAGAGAPPGVEIVSQPPDFPGLLAQADMAVTAAGTTCWELACFGVPFIAVSTAANQVQIAASLERAGVARDAGWHADLTPERLREEVFLLAADAGRRQAMSEAGRALVDGRGAARVAALLAAEKAA